MVIQVFVHSTAPGVRRQRTEERMWVPRASGFSPLVELPDLHFKLLPLSCEIFRLGYDELLARGAFLRERLFIVVDGFHNRTDDPANKDTRRVQPSRCYVH